MKQAEAPSLEKLRVDHTTFWNLRGRAAPPPIIEREQPGVREVGPATITPWVHEPKIKGPRNGAVRYSKGALYDDTGRILPEFRLRQLFDRDAEAGNRLRNKFILDADRPPPRRRLEGRYAYMGFMRGHFGHFLLETLCRLWFMLEADRDVRFLFHGYVQLAEMPSFARYVFDLLEIDESRVTVVDEHCAIDHLLMPDSAFEIRWKARAKHADAFAELYDRNFRRTGLSSDVKRLYLTRRQLNVRRKAAARKEVLNEDRVEHVFADRNFHIVAPERLPFPEQIALIGGANQIAGLKGSALHMSLFSQQPRAKLIQIDKSPSMNQCLIDALKGMESHHIICKKEQEGGGFRVDMDVLRQALREI